MICVPERVPVLISFSSHHMGPIIRLGNGNLRCAEQVHRLQVVASVGGRSYIDEAFTSEKWKPTESSPAKE